MFRIESYITPIIINYVDKYVKNFRPQDAQVRFGSCQWESFMKSFILHLGLNIFWWCGISKPRPSIECSGRGFGSTIEIYLRTRTWIEHSYSMGETCLGTDCCCHQHNWVCCAITRCQWSPNENVNKGTNVASTRTPTWISGVSSQENRK